MHFKANYELKKYHDPICYHTQPESILNSAKEKGGKDQKKKDRFSFMRLSGLVSLLIVYSERFVMLSCKQQMTKYNLPES